MSTTIVQEPNFSFFHYDEVNAVLSYLSEPKIIDKKAVETFIIIKQEDPFHTEYGRG